MKKCVSLHHTSCFVLQSSYLTHVFMFLFHISVCQKLKAICSIILCFPVFKYLSKHLLPLAETGHFVMAVPQCLCFNTHRNNWWG